MLVLTPQIEALLNEGATLVVPSRQRATAVRLAHATAAVQAGRRVWRSPDALAWTGWIEREWLRSGVDDRRLLRPAEEWLLWRAVARDALGDLDPLFHNPMTEGLRRAAALMADWSIPPSALRSGAGSETLLLARTLRAFEERCNAERLLAPMHLAGRLLEGPAPKGVVQLAGFDPLTAIQRRIVDSLPAWAPRAMAAPAAAAVPAVAAAAALDRDHELELIAEWARRRLRVDARARLLVVLPGLAERGPQLARLLRAALRPQSVLGLLPDGETPPFAIEGGQPLASYALIAHALEGLGACVAALDFPRLSAWLRAPFWAEPDAAARARIDLWLRSRDRTALGLRALAEALGAASVEACPDAAALESPLRAALAALGTGVAPLQLWAERFRAALDALRWPGIAAPTSADEQLRARFIELLQEYGEIGVGAGNLGFPEALALLRDLAARVAFEPATGDSAVAVTDVFGDPIVRYDGIWVAGLEADAWPAPARPDPFIPMHVQRAAGVPHATAAGQLALARAVLERWRNCSAELVLSHARRVDDAQGVPSPLIAQVAVAAYEPVGRVPSFAASLSEGGPLEELADDVAPVWPAAAPLPSGTRALELQNQCPFRAFAELRLEARPLEAPQPGVDLRTRGRLLHRALETLWQEIRGSEGLAARSPEALLGLIERHVQAAAVQILETPERDAAPRLNERELRRAVRLIGELCELERERAPFTVQALEMSRRLDLPGATLSMRLDRVDRLEGGTLAIIDYKTGRPTPQQWFTEPVSNPQLLAYLLALEGEVVALATAHVARTGVEFRGIAGARDLLPGVGPKGGTRSREAPSDLPWALLLERWRAIARRLIRDFVAGAASVDPADGACDICHLQAFCRIADLPRFEPDAEGEDDD